MSAMIRPKGLGGPPTDTYHCEYCGADFPYGSDHSPDDCIAHLRAQLLAARAEALEEEANATSDLLNALAEDCEKAIAAHRISAFHEFPQTCGGCHWWAGFAGALTEIRFRRQNPEQVMHPAIAALRAKGGGK